MQKGFSLIEIMIVIAVLGILTALVTVSYVIYTKKTIVSIGLNEVASLKVEYEMAVNEHYSNLGNLSNIQSKASQYCNFTTNPPDAITKIAEKALICTFKNTALLGGDAQIYLTRDTAGQYSCHTQNIAKKYLPKNCF